jgi:hypothetical protein
MDEVLLQCRDFRHAWATETPYYKVPIEGGVKNALYVERIIACMRCDSKRVELYRVFKTHLDRIATHYKYAEGYQIKGVKKGDAVQSKVRHELYERAMENVKNITEGSK